MWRTLFRTYGAGPRPAAATGLDGRPLTGRLGGAQTHRCGVLRVCLQLRHAVVCKLLLPIVQSLRGLGGDGASGRDAHARTSPSHRRGLRRGSFPPLSLQWREVARELQGVVSIGVVNCNVDMLCRRTNIMTFPSLIFYAPGKKQNRRPITYQGEHEVDDMVEFVLRNLGSDAGGNVQRWTSGAGLEHALRQRSRTFVVALCDEPHCEMARKTMVKVGARLLGMIGTAVVAHCQSATMRAFCEALMGSPPADHEASHSFDSIWVYVGSNTTASPMRLDAALNCTDGLGDGTTSYAALVFSRRSVDAIAALVLQELPKLPVIGDGSDNLTAAVAQIRAGTPGGREVVLLLIAEPVSCANDSSCVRLEHELRRASIALQPLSVGVAVLHIPSYGALWVPAASEAGIAADILPTIVRRPTVVLVKPNRPEGGFEKLLFGASTVRSAEMLVQFARDARDSNTADVGGNVDALAGLLNSGLPANATADVVVFSYAQVNCHDCAQMVPAWREQARIHAAGVNMDDDLAWVEPGGVASAPGKRKLRFLMLDCDAFPDACPLGWPSIDVYIAGRTSAAHFEDLVPAFGAYYRKVVATRMVELASFADYDQLWANATASSCGDGLCRVLLLQLTLRRGCPPCNAHKSEFLFASSYLQLAGGRSATVDCDGGESRRELCVWLTSQGDYPRTAIFVVGRGRTMLESLPGIVRWPAVIKAAIGHAGLAYGVANDVSASALRNLLAAGENGATPRACLVYYYAPWCGPCMHFKDYFAAAAAVLDARIGRDTLHTVLLDCQRYPDECRDIRQYPTVRLYYMHNGRRRTEPIQRAEVDPLLGTVYRRLLQAGLVAQASVPTPAPSSRLHEEL